MLARHTWSSKIFPIHKKHHLRQGSTLIVSKFLCMHPWHVIFQSEVGTTFVWHFLYEFTIKVKFHSLCITFWQLFHQINFLHALHISDNFPTLYSKYHFGISLFGALTCIISEDGFLISFDNNHTLLATFQMKGDEWFESKLQNSFI